MQESLGLQSTLLESPTCGSSADTEHSSTNAFSIRCQKMSIVTEDDRRIFPAPAWSRNANLHEAWHQLCQVQAPVGRWGISAKAANKNNTSSDLSAQDSQTSPYMEVFLDKRFKENYHHASALVQNWSSCKTCT